MRILTYADPFGLQEDPEIWELITKHPHYCASDTLVQGLTTHYGRENFGIIRPIQDLINACMRGYSNNAINDMQLYLTVTNCIRKWEDSALKKAFLFNKTNVVEAIRLLLPLMIEPDQMNRNLLSQEQTKLLEIYKEVWESDCCDALKGLKKKTKIDFIEDIRATAAEEIKHLARDIPDNREALIAEGIDLWKWNVGKALSAGQALVEYHQRKGHTIRAHEIEVAVKACKRNTNTQYYETIVINGIHRFTSEIVYLIRDLESRMKVEIVFLIPYAEHLSAIYDTWKNVYEWTKLDFEKVHDIGKAKHIDAIHMADVLSGRSTGKENGKKLLEYDNLTSFALHEVGRVYNQAKEEAPKENNRLNRMTTQFYAVNSRSCNELLKMFYPEQFESKPFLSYPIGQLILGIYRMWDFEKSALKLDVDILAECAVSGLFQEDQDVCAVLRKMKLFFRGAETRLEYRKRIADLRDFKIKMADNEKFAGLSKLGFLNVTDEELIALQEFVDQLCSIAFDLFKGNTSEQINYIAHFDMLMNKVTEAANRDNRLLPEEERQLISDIRDQLKTSARTSVYGSLKDVSDALAFFLSGKMDSDSSHWIVRDFEQIDGAVLLSKHTNATAYHFAMLSNEHMLKQNQEDLPWPLTVKMFDAYEAIRKDIDAVAASVRERRNFLKFSLFYGTYFSEKELKFSFIREEDDEEQTPYYLFSAMGYETEIADRAAENTQDDTKPGIQPNYAVIFPQDDESKELFSICPFKYLMNKVIGADLEYYSDYHIYLFLKYYLTYIAKDPKYAADDTRESIKLVIDDLRSVFPFLGPTTFNDLIRDSGIILMNNPYTPDFIHNRKVNFLLAGWSGEWQPNFNISRAGQAMQAYMSDETIYPSEEKLPRHTICDHCNYVGICLRDFYMSHTIESDEELEELSETEIVTED